MASIFDNHCRSLNNFSSAQWNIPIQFCQCLRRWHLLQKLPATAQREYLLVTQDQPSIERYVRQGDVWILSEAVGLEAFVSLESIDCVLSLREVYDKVVDDVVIDTEANQAT